ncbi:LacI family transcriptional regulator, partial [Rhizobiaceae sp. 2RAB30]
QPVWVDPETGYVRRHLSPPTDMPLELVRVELPAGARVAFPAASYAFIRQQIWLIEGRLDFTEGDVVHAMAAGDCLALGSPADCAFHAPGPERAVYLVALVRGART